MAKTAPKRGKGKSVGRYVAPEARGRITARRPVSSDHSPRWFGWLLIDLLAFGLLIITLNYLSVLPGSTSSWYLVLGLVSMFAAFFLATIYR